MNTTKTKKTISLLLTIAMIFSLLPAISTGGAAEPSEEPAAEAIAVTPEPLSDSLRYQKGFHAFDLTLPDTIPGTIDGVLQDIPVTWDSETDYTKPGLHIITAQPAEGYTFTPDAPIVTFMSESMMRTFGSGIAAEPLAISTAAQLAEISALAKAGKLEEFVLGNADATINIKLTKNIDLSYYGSAWNSGNGWVPIGTDNTKPFKGNFDGDGHKITGLFMNNNSADHAGLFGYVDGGTIQKLGVEGANVTGGANTGIIAGTLTNGGKIENCYTMGSVSGTTAGGIAGTVGGTGSIVQNCYSTAAVTGTTNAGGIVGSLGAGCSVLTSVALNPKINGSNAGRVVGDNSSGTLNYNYAYVDMKNSSDQNFTGGTLSDTNGKDISIGAALNEAPNWSYAGYVTWGNPWKFATGKLPGFDVVGLDAPEHFLRFSYFAGGTGSAVAPYEIKTAEQLKKLADLVNAGGANNEFAASYTNYKLMNDIDLSDYASDGGWVPIGTDADYKRFRGYFDGGGNKITGLYINNNSQDYKGLFGAVYGGTIENLGVVGVDITGRNYIGGIVGSLGEGGKVTNCYVTGTITGVNYLGGIAGYLGIISNSVRYCYSTAAVTGTGQYVGGIAGFVYGSIISFCYSTGAIKGNRYVGGIVGQVCGERMASNNSLIMSTISDCVAMNQSVTKTESNSDYVGRVAGEFKKYTDAQMELGAYEINKTSRLHALTDMKIYYNNTTPYSPSASPEGENGANRQATDVLNGTTYWSTASYWYSSTWDIAVGKLPGLKVFNDGPVEPPLHLLPSGYAFNGGGDGSVGTPYLIATAGQLKQLADLVNAGTGDYATKYYKLTADIDLSDYSGLKGWTPIGTDSNNFKGNFDGGNFKITGLIINASTSENVGLFGVVDGSSAVVQDLNVENAKITGHSTVGIIAGLVTNSGTITNCTASGTVSGTSNVGGLAGKVSGNVEESSSTAAVSGTNEVGGLVGLIGGSTITNSYATGNVTGNSANVGGLAGQIESGSTITNSYATGNVTGDSSVGGLVGLLNGGSVTDCYATGNVTGTGTTGGLVGSASGGITNCFATGAVSGDTNAGGIAGSLGSGVSITNSVALNPSVSGSTNVGRVVGDKGSGTLSGNHAFKGMTNGSGGALTSGSATNVDGEDADAYTVREKTFWTSTLGFDSTSTWTLDGTPLTQLPKLTGVGEASDFGIYIMAHLFSVTFDANGGTGTTPSAITGIKSGETVAATSGASIPDGTGLTKTGHDFKGWNTKASGDGDDFTETTQVTAHMTVYAKWEKKTFTVTFNNNGGDTASNPTTKTAQYEGTVGTLPTEPTKTGHAFLAWNTDSGGNGTEFKGDTVVTGDIEVYAQWLASTYTVTFNLTGGTDSGRNMVQVTGVAHGTIVAAESVPTDPTKTGHTFKQWVSGSPESENVFNPANDTITSNITVYAQWTPVNCVVTFDVNGGDSVSQTTKDVPYGSAAGALPVPTRAGYEFKGWYTASSGGTVFDATTAVTETTKTVYAQWEVNKYTVTFNLNGGSGNAPTALTNVAHDYQIQSNDIPSPAPTREGYTFLGWFTATSGGTAFDTSYTVTSTITVYAQWQIKNYTVTFKLEGGKINENTADVTENIDHGSSFGQRLPVPTRQDYIFKGWNSDQDGTGTAFADNTPVELEGMVLYAQWEAGFIPNRTVTFNENYGVNPAATTKTVPDGTTLGANMPTDPTREGYTFLGWNTVRTDGTFNTAFTASTTVTADIEVYAQWQIKTYTISFNLSYSGSGTAPSDITVAHGSSAGTLPTPTRTGYVFTEWHIQSTTTKYTGGEPVTDNVNLVAQWEINKYTVTFNLNDGSGGTLTPATGIEHGGTVVAVSIPTPSSRTGYTFVSWNTKADGTGAPFTDNTQVTGNIAVYAQWTAETYTVTFNVNGGTSVAPTPIDNIKYGSTISATSGATWPDNPTKAPDTFLGWYTGAADAPGMKFTKDTPVTESITVYAQWQVSEAPAPQEHTVTFNPGGGTINDSSATVDYKVTSGSTIAMLPVAVKEGHTFTQWQDDGGTEFTNTTQVNDDMNITAQWTANKYTVTYDKNDGTDNSASYETKTNINHGTNVGQLATQPTRDGYDFVQWNLQSDGSGLEFLASTPVTASITVYAIWRPKVISYYVVIFDAVDGTVDGSNRTLPITVSENSKIAVLPEPTKTGHRFIKWVYGSSGTEFTTNTAVIGNMTVTAVWEINKYTVRYNKNDGTGGTHATKDNINHGGNVGILPTAPTRDGYDFVQWNLQSDGSGTEFIASTPVTADITVYAIWTQQGGGTTPGGGTTWTVTLDARGGTLSGLSITTMSVTKGAAAGTLPTPTRTGFTFAGWFTQPDGAGTQFIVSTRVTADITIYAKWTQQSGTTTHTVTFNVNGGTPVSAVTVTKGTAVGTQMPVPTRTGYTFTGWHDSSGAPYSGTAPVTADITLTAQWQINTYTVTFNLNGGEGTAPGPISADYLQTVTLPAPPTRTGYNFVEWNTQQGGGGTKFDAATQMTANVMVYAIWTAKTYTVTFNINGGDGLAPAQITGIAYGSSVTGASASMPADPSRTGHNFVDWYIGAGGTGMKFTADTQITQDITVYARWVTTGSPRPTDWTVTFDPNGGTINSVSTQLTVTVSANSTIVMLPVPVKTGYTFGGWANGATSFTAATQVTGNITVTAQWTINTHTVTYNKNDGTGGTHDTKTGVNYNTGVGQLPAEPTRTGYDFVGWYPQSDGSGTEFDASTPVTDDITVYAIWTQQTAIVQNYTVTFMTNDGTTTVFHTVPGIPDGTAIGTANMPSTAPTRTGYTFSGWNTQADGDFNTAFSASTLIVANTTVYAIWTQPNTGGGGGGGGGSGSGDSGGDTGSGSGNTGGGGGGSDFAPAGGGGGNLSTSGSSEIVESWLVDIEQLIEGDTTVLVVDGFVAGEGTLITTGNVTELTFDTDVWDKALNDSDSAIIAAVPNISDTQILAIPLDYVQAFDEKGITLSFQFGDILYPLTLSPAILEDVYSSLGVTNASDATLKITVGKITDEEAANAASGAIAENGGEMLGTPIEFSITVYYGNESREIDLFEEYVKRVVGLTEETVNAGSVVVIEPDGSVRHVPTFVYKARNGKYYAIISSVSNSVYAFAKNTNTFADVTDKWYTEDVIDMLSRTVIKGVSDLEFAGEREITRAEFAAVIVRALGLPKVAAQNSFADVSGDSWYYEAVEIAHSFGLMQGDENGLFHPDSAITRQETMLVLYRASQLVNYQGRMGNTQMFSDYEEISAWAEQATSWCSGSGLIMGHTGRIRPTDNITRAETAAVIRRFLQSAQLINMTAP